MLHERKSNNYREVNIYVDVSSNVRLDKLASEFHAVGYMGQMAGVTECNKKIIFI